MGRACDVFVYWNCMGGWGWGWLFFLCVSAFIPDLQWVEGSGGWRVGFVECFVFSCLIVRWIGEEKKRREGEAG